MNSPLVINDQFWYGMLAGIILSGGYVIALLRHYTKRVKEKNQPKSSHPNSEN